MKPWDIWSCDIGHRYKTWFTTNPSVKLFKDFKAHRAQVNRCVSVHVHASMSTLRHENYSQELMNTAACVCASAN